MEEPGIAKNVSGLCLLNRPRLRAGLSSRRARAMMKAEKTGRSPEVFVERTTTYAAG